MERIYIVANTTKFPVLLKDLNVIVPAKAAVNLFELAPELSIERIEADKKKGMLGLRLSQGILVSVQTNSSQEVRRAACKEESRG